MSTTVEEASRWTHIELFAMIRFQRSDFGAESGIAKEVRAVRHFNLEFLLHRKLKELKRFL